MATITVVVATHNRRERLLGCVAALTSLPDQVQIIVVDNASDDGSADAVQARFGTAKVIRLRTNRGAVARNIGVEAATTPIVAFADDDSGWLPGSLAAAAQLFDVYPRLGLIAARVHVGAERRIDPICHAMARASAGTDDDLPGPNVLGFLAFAAVVRRTAFLGVGGFDDIVFFMGEEDRVAYDLQRDHWGLSYCAEIVAVHDPAVAGAAARRERQLLAARNRALTFWMRRPIGPAIAATAALVGRTAFHRRDWPYLDQFRLRFPGAIRARRSPCTTVEKRLRRANRPSVDQSFAGLSEWAGARSRTRI
jgi:GT2 family glycosyltransferase